jgi:hypothetical protein
MNLVNLDIKPQNIFVGDNTGRLLDNIIYMDLGTSMVLSPLEEGDDLSHYLVSFATKGYSSTKFYQACGFEEGSV